MKYEYIMDSADWPTPEQLDDALANLSDWINMFQDIYLNQTINSFPDLD